MKLTILSEKEEPLLKRKAVKAEISEYGATPSKAAVKEDIAKKLKTDAALVDIASLKHGFGGGKVTLTCYVYKDAKMADLLGKEGHKKRIAAKKAKAAPAAQ
ncbi:MAG: hypothetical protein PHO02_04415 [Candidatus Nanoarchaeia archaeon]|nr:hypothetical protein [Candidatus Nanoarchaeia archaeon]